MLQHSSDQSNGSEDSGRGLERKEERKYYDGFEGMNFEQRRQPYHSRKASNRNQEELNQRGFSEPRGDEL